jgi:hypothetical protein
MEEDALFFSQGNLQRKKYIITRRMSVPVMMSITDRHSWNSGNTHKSLLNKNPIEQQEKNCTKEW